MRTQEGVTQKSRGIKKKLRLEYESLRTVPRMRSTYKNVFN